MTRFPLGLGGVREEEIPGTIEWQYGNTYSSSISNVPLGAVGDTRKIVIVYHSYTQSDRPTAATLDGFSCTFLASVRGQVGSFYSWFHYFIIDAGVGSFLESNIDADLSTTFSNASGWLAIYRLEHIESLRYIATSASSTNAIGVTLPVKNGDVIEAGINAMETFPAGFTWSGATQDYIQGTTSKLGSVASGEIASDNSGKTISCTVPSSQKLMLGGAVFDKLGNPTFEVTDNDMQTSVSGSVMTSSSLDIGSGDDRTLIIAHVTMAQNVTFAGVKCNGVSMTLAAKNNDKTYATSTPMSGGLFYIKFSDLPDLNTETADFEITAASGNCNASIVVGVMHGGRGNLVSSLSSKTYSTINPVQPSVSPVSPHVTIFGISLPRRAGTSQTITYTTSGGYRYATKLYDEGTGNNSRNYMVSLGAVTLGNGGVDGGTNAAIDAYLPWNSDVTHQESNTTYITTVGVFI